MHKHACMRLRIPFHIHMPRTRIHTLSILFNKKLLNITVISFINHGCAHFYLFSYQLLPVSYLSYDIVFLAKTYCLLRIQYA